MAFPFTIPAPHLYRIESRFYSFAVVFGADIEKREIPFCAHSASVFYAFAVILLASQTIAYGFCFAHRAQQFLVSPKDSLASILTFSSPRRLLLFISSSFWLQLFHIFHYCHVFFKRSSNYPCYFA